MSLIKLFPEYIQTQKKHKLSLTKDEIMLHGNQPILTEPGHLELSSIFEKYKLEILPRFESDFEKGQHERYEDHKQALVLRVNWNLDEELEKSFFETISETRITPFPVYQFEGKDHPGAKVGVRPDAFLIRSDGNWEEIDRLLNESSFYFDKEAYWWKGNIRLYQSKEAFALESIERMLVSLPGTTGYVDASHISISLDDLLYSGSDGNSDDDAEENTQLEIPLPWHLETIKLRPSDRFLDESTLPLITVIDNGCVNRHMDLPDDLEVPDFPNLNVPKPHGTAVVGLIASRIGNGLGIDGITGAKLLALDAINKSGKEILDAIEYAVYERQAKILNLSWGFFPEEESNEAVLLESNMIAALIKQVMADGVLVVVAAGNDELANQELPFPARLEGCMAVGAIGKNLRRLNISNYTLADNPHGISVVAPGEALKTIGLNNQFIQDFGGTSGAAPLVAGVAALVWQKMGMDTPAWEVKRMIESSAAVLATYRFDDNSNYPNGKWNKEVGYGLLDAEAALADLA